MLDVNAGIPLVDEAELLQEHAAHGPGRDRRCRSASTPRSSRRSRPASPVYEGKALVNSVTGEDERLEEILPLVAQARRGGRSALANDETGIPETPQQRLEIATKIVRVAGDYGIQPEDIVIDPLAMTVGAATDAVTITLETIRLIRDAARREHVPRRLERVVRPARPPRPERRVPADGDGGRPDERDHEHRRRCASRASAPPTCCSATTRGARAGSPPTARARRRWPTPRDRAPVPAPVDEPATRTAATARGADGAERVRLRFLPDGADVRVPSGTPIFDAASWNGIAIDSTCGGHGTCKKCKVRIVEGDVPVGPVDPRAFSARRAARRLAAGLPGDRARRPRGRGAAAADPARRRRSPASGAT